MRLPSCFTQLVAQLVRRKGSFRLSRKRCTFNSHILSRRVQTGVLRGRKPKCCPFNSLPGTAGYSIDSVRQMCCSPWYGWCLHCIAFIPLGEGGPWSMITVVISTFLSINYNCSAKGACPEALLLNSSDELRLYGQTDTGTTFVQSEWHRWIQDDGFKLVLTYSGFAGFAHECLGLLKFCTS